MLLPCSAAGASSHEAHANCLQARQAANLADLLQGMQDQGEGKKAPLDRRSCCNFRRRTRKSCRHGSVISLVGETYVRHCTAWALRRIAAGASPKSDSSGRLAVMPPFLPGPSGTTLRFDECDSPRPCGAGRLGGGWCPTRGGAPAMLLP
jgi:hypothetical protein